MTSALRLTALLACVLSAAIVADAANPRTVLREAQSRVVKIYGAGGLGSLEAYQTGLLVSGEGHVLTVNSSVLDTDGITVVTLDGSRRTGEVLAANPVADIAVVKIDPAGEALPYWDLSAPRAVGPGEPVWALANEFNIATGNEPVSVRQGVVAGLASLRGRVGVSSRVGQGESLLLDMVTSNPGAPGGAVIDLRGQLLGMLGRELQAEATGAWVSHATPTARLARAYADLLAGTASEQAADKDLPAIAPLQKWGFALVPGVGPRTPPYVDYVRPNSAADLSGLRADDLVVIVDSRVTATRDAFLHAAGESVAETLSVTVQRDDVLIDLTINAASTPNQTSNNSLP